MIFAGSKKYEKISVHNLVSWSWSRFVQSRVQKHAFSFVKGFTHFTINMHGCFCCSGLGSTAVFQTCSWQELVELMFSTFNSGFDRSTWLYSGRWQDPSWMSETLPTKLVCQLYPLQLWLIYDCCFPCQNKRRKLWENLSCQKQISASLELTASWCEELSRKRSCWDRVSTKQNGIFWGSWQLQNKHMKNVLGWTNAWKWSCRTNWRKIALAGPFCPKICSCQDQFCARPNRGPGNYGPGRTITGN